MTGNQQPREACFLTRGEQDTIRKALQYYAQAQQDLITREWEKLIKPFAAKTKPVPADVRAKFDYHKMHHTDIQASADALHERFRVGDHRRDNKGDK